MNVSRVITPASKLVVAHKLEKKVEAIIPSKYGIALYNVFFIFLYCLNIVLQIGLEKYS